MHIYALIVNGEAIEHYESEQEARDAVKLLEKVKIPAEVKAVAVKPERKNLPQPYRIGEYPDWQKIFDEYDKIKKPPRWPNEPIITFCGPGVNQL